VCKFAHRFEGVVLGYRVEILRFFLRVLADPA